MDPGRFFPPLDEEDDDPGLAAKEVCATCAVREVCLEAALRNRELHGVWGGMTARERRRMVRRARRARARRATAA